MTFNQRDHRRSLLISGAIIIILLFIIYRLAGVLFPFAIGGVLAYMLFPIVRVLERVMPWQEKRPTLSRIIAIAIVIVVALGIIAGSLALIIPQIVNEATLFIADLPEIFQDARATIEQLNREYTERIPEEIKQNIEEGLADAGNILLGAIQDAFLRVAGFITNSFSLVIGLSIIPIFLFYLLKDQRSLSDGIYTPVPVAIRPHLRNVASIINQIIGSYIRGQLLLGVVVGTLTALGLFLLGIPFQVLLGIVAGITELMPIIGPWIGGAVGVLVTLATAPEKVIWVILLYLGIQVLENSFLVPRIQGNALDLHPIAMMVVIVIGSHLFGLWGVILGPLVAAVAKEVIKYFVEQWNRPALPLGSLEDIKVASSLKQQRLMVQPRQQGEACENSTNETSQSSN
jgi:predicted PurR-regulated permease PerM